MTVIYAIDKQQSVKRVNLNNSSKESVSKYIEYLKNGQGWTNITIYKKG